MAIGVGEDATEPELPSCTPVDLCGAAQCSTSAEPLSDELVCSERASRQPSRAFALGCARIQLSSTVERVRVYTSPCVYVSVYTSSCIRHRVYVTVYIRAASVRYIKINSQINSPVPVSDPVSDPNDPQTPMTR